MKSFMTALTTLVIALSTFAHEGHDKTPGALTAPHGGQLKGTSELYIELVSDPTGFKLYTTDHEMKIIAIKNVKIDATLKLPKKKKSEKINLKPHESFLETKVDAKGFHRYTVDLKITYNGKTETVSFNVEPQE